MQEQQGMGNANSGGATLSNSFVFNSLDDRSLSFLRNASAFTLLFDERTSCMVHKVISLPGHFAVLLNQRSSESSPTLSFPTLLCIFDNVSPSTSSFSSSSSSSTSASSKEWITAIQNLPHSSITTSNSLGGVHVSHHSSPIIEVLFDIDSALSFPEHHSDSDIQKVVPATQNPNGNLRVFVVEASADVHAWQWNAGQSTIGTQTQATDNTWRYLGKGILPGYSKNINTIESVLFVASEQKIYYLLRIDTVEIRLCACDVAFNSTTGTDPSMIKIGAKREVIFNHSFPTRTWSEQETKLKLYLSPKQGIWIASNRNVLFYDFRSKVYNFVSWWSNNDSISTGSSSEFEPQHSNPNRIVLSTTVHPVTGDFIFVDDLGNVMALTGGGVKGVRRKLLMQVQLQHKKYVRMWVHRHMIGFLSSECGICSVFDLRSGTPLGEARIPQTYSLLSKKRDQLITSVGDLNGIECHYQLCEIGLNRFAFDVIVWSSAGGGVWKLVMPSIKNQMNITTNPLPVSNNLSSLSALQLAVKTFNDWKLTQWQARYALDTLQLANKTGENMIKKDMYKEIVPLLQNPALAVALLASGDSPLHDTSVINEIENHLRTFYCSPLDADKGSQSNLRSTPYSLDEGKRIAVRLAFHVHTPLNAQMSPLLGEFLQKTLREQKSKNEPKSLVRRRRRKQSVLMMSQNEAKMMEQNRPSIADVERAHLESLARLDPTQTLQKLEVAMNLSNFEDYVSYASPSLPSPLSMLISPSSPTSRAATTSLLPTPRDELWKIPEEELTVLLMKGVRNPVHPYFEIMCRLYYQLKPNLLLPFVELVTATATKNPGQQSVRGKRIPNFYERSLSSLPILINLESDQLSNSQIEARTQLLLKCAKPSEAVEILLQTKKYERALKILEDSFKLHPNGLEHYELFHLLFCDSLRRKDTQLCKRLFDFLPSNLRVLDLIKVTSHHLSKSVEEDRTGSGAPKKKIIRRQDENDKDRHASLLTVALFRPLLLSMFEKEKEEDVAL